MENENGKTNTGFDVLVKTPKSRPAPISLKSTKPVLKNVVQTAKREWKKRPSGIPTLVRRDRKISREREGASSLKTLRSRQTEGEVDSRTDAEAERIWQEAMTEEDNNRSIITRAALLERMETGSRKGSVLNENREGGELNFVKKCVLKTDNSSRELTLCLSSTGLNNLRIYLFVYLNTFNRIL